MAISTLSKFTVPLANDQSSASQGLLMPKLQYRFRAILENFGVSTPRSELTRNEIKGAIESFLLELVGQRALFDFLVVCDDTNNTPTRVDRNELYVDIAIEPIKSVEFI